MDEMTKTYMTDLVIKSVSEDERILTGIASTPKTDRMGDVVNPKGAIIDLPIPFLWQHDHDKPIGEVTKATVSDEGIEVQVQIAKIEEDGSLKELVDRAWQAIKHKLVKGLSIGFRGLEYSQKGDGLYFDSWELVELSAVTIPCNPEAVITSVKAVQDALNVNDFLTPADSHSATSHKEKIMSVKDLIQAAKTAKADKEQAVQAILSDKGFELSQEDEAKVAELEKGIGKIEENIARLEKMGEADEQKAQPSQEVKTLETPAPVGALKAVTAEKGYTPYIEVKSNLPKGVAFVQNARAKLLAQKETATGNVLRPVDAAKALGFSSEVISYIAKANQGITTNPDYKPLLDQDVYQGEFVELLRNATVLDKLQGFRKVPFNTKINGFSRAASASWVGEAQRIPLTDAAFKQLTVGEHKVAAISVFSSEMLRRSSVAFDMFMRDELVRASAYTIDNTFIGDQDRTETTPMGILNGVTVITKDATEDASIGMKTDKDLEALLSAFVGANDSLDGTYFLMSATHAARLALLRNPVTGVTYYPSMNISGTGNALLGIPVVTSEAMGNKIVLIKPSNIFLADEGGVEIMFSSEATLTDGANTYSLYQEQSSAVRIVKPITWEKARDIVATTVEAQTE